MPALPGHTPVPASRFRRDYLRSRSSIPSTGVFCLRATPGDGGHQGREISGRVFIPVAHESAFLTAENTLRKRQRRLGRAAPGTMFAASIEGRRFDHDRPVPGTLIPELATDLRQGRISQRPGEPAVLPRARHVQLFDDHHAIGGRQMVRQVVKGILADVPGPRMEPGQPAASLLPPPGCPSDGEPGRGSTRRSFRALFPGVAGSATLRPSKGPPSAAPPRPRPPPATGTEASPAAAPPRG